MANLLEQAIDCDDADRGCRSAIEPCCVHPAIKASTTVSALAVPDAHSWARITCATVSRLTP